MPLWHQARRGLTFRPTRRVLLGPVPVLAYDLPASLHGRGLLPGHRERGWPPRRAGTARWRDRNGLDHCELCGGVGLVAKRRLKVWIGKAALLSGGTLVALILAEGLTRLAYPISDGGQNVTLDGEPIAGWTVPGTVYHQIGTEYDALTTITDKGHRAPAVEGNPDVVFIGDSFTFGWGLSDEETFAAIYCRARGLMCANLGRPATGTAQQLDRLEMFLEEWAWRPKQVNLFIFAMTSSFSAGNDLRDNYWEVRWSNHVPGQRLRDAAADSDSEAADHSAIEAAQLVERETEYGGVLERVLGYREALLARSNLLRIVKFYWGPLIRSMLVPGLDEGRLSEALALTEAELKRLAEISEEYEFDYAIYLLHPVQDIIRGTHTETLAALNEISSVPIRGTASVFKESPKSFYYSYDGHINSLGSQRIAELLLATADAPGGSS